MCFVEVFCYKVSLNDVLLCADTGMPTISVSDSLNSALAKTEMWDGANLTLHNVLRTGRVINLYNYVTC